MAVLVDTVVGVATDKDVVVAVDGDHGHLAQHVEHGLRLRLAIGLHVVAHTVELLLDELALGLDDDAVELLVPRDGVGSHASRVGGHAGGVGVHAGGVGG